MSKSKLTLIIDGNWLLRSRQAVLNNKYIDDEQMCHELKLMMIRSINIVLRQFTQIDNIIFVADGGSWRNHIEIPNFLVDNTLSQEVIDTIKQLLKEYAKTHEVTIDIDNISPDNFTLSNLKEYDIDYSQLPVEQVEYKGNRTKDESVNWDLIFKSYEQFISTLNSTGITVAKEPGVEGDDWVWYWSNKLNSEGTNVIIWTKDKDLTQLVKIDKNKCFTIWWNKESGVYAPEYNDNDMDFLFNPEFSSNEELFTDICKKAKQLTQINPKEVVIDKIIRGDAGDNILPVVLRKAKNPKSTNLRLYKISPKDMDFTLNIHDLSVVREYFTNLLSSPNYVGRVDKPVNEVIEHFIYNTKLVALEKESYPQEILDILKTYDTYKISKDISEAESQISAEANNIENILNIL